MKLKFKIQEYQTAAVEAVTKVFEGQPFNDFSHFMRDVGIRKNQQMNQFDENSIDGFNNAEIELTDAQLINNIQAIQLQNNIKQSSELSKPFGNNCRCALDIEMETGTGKTYCYIKTMFELNKKYGWSKFVVVVPSIAIREGVKKSFEVMEDHFFEYYGKKARYFIYNSKNLNQLDNFSSSKDIYVMIINSQAFATSLKEGAKNEAARIIYSKQDSFGSRRPIDVIAVNRPIIILDEPQKLGGEATQDGIKAFNPMFTLNYSATHRNIHNPVYVLDALDAYRKKLVKKIEVKGFELRNLRGTDGFVYLSKILLDPKKPPMARITFEINYAKSINRETRILGVGDNLYELSSGNNGKMRPLEQYKNGFVIKEINPIDNTITFLNGLVLAVDEVHGNMNEQDMRRIQIRETILSHFEKEEKLFNLGIKCLSLFFIDEVAHYRQYDDDGNEKLGDYGKMFEEEYVNVLNDYITLIESPYVNYLKSIDVHDTHKGYFSIDKKTNRVVNSVEKRGICDDISAYDLILKNKERLLSFDEPTRFIFSHSALREGWDNPNIFQICTLKQSNSEINKRQEVGRGMRLCVDSAGDRIDGSKHGLKVHDINVLTVIASDSYKTFVGDLQKEIKSALYERPTNATKEYFTGKIIVVDDKKVVLSAEQAAKIERYLAFNGYIDYNGCITDAYRDAKEKDSFAQLPAELSDFSDGIHGLIQSVYDEKAFESMIDSANKPKITDNSLNDNFDKAEFKKLWDYISHKYAYTVDFDSEELIKRSICAIDDKLFVTELTYVKSVGAQNDESTDFTEAKTKTVKLHSSGGSGAKYDLIGKIAQGTTLTRRTAVRILQGIQDFKFNMFKQNPEEFINKVIKLINEQKAGLIINEIKYDITDEEPYSSDIFNLGGVVSFEKAVKVNKHITPYVVVDSEIEKKFAIDLDRDEDKVCVYAKLPKSFRIPTPVGNYSPDWAIAFYEKSVKYIYFIAETKGSEEHRDPIEIAKNLCAKKLFDKLSNGKVRYDVVDSYRKLLDVMNK